MKNEVTLAPLPSISDIFSALFRPKLAEVQLAESWCRDDENGVWLSQSAWSIFVIAKCRMAMFGNNQRQITVWIPEYFCNISLVYLRELGVKIVFYPIDQEMLPDVEWCYQESIKSKSDIFVHVHYFGKVVPVENTFKFCKEMGAWLIEDCAHVLRPIPGIGEYGDFVLYSPHKTLAIPDGAVLIARKSGPSLIFESIDVINQLLEIKALIKHTGSTFFPSLVWLCKRFLQRIGLRGRIGISGFWPDMPCELSSFASPNMSTFAKKLLSTQVQSLDEIGMLREQNLKIWEKCSVNRCNLYHKLKILTFDTPPYLAAVSFDNKDDAERYFNLLQSDGFLVQTWPDLPPEVLNNPVQYSTSIFLRQSRFFFPVHQTISIDETKNLSKRATQLFLENGE